MTTSKYINLDLGIDFNTASVGYYKTSNSKLYRFYDDLAVEYSKKWGYTYGIRRSKTTRFKFDLSSKYSWDTLTRDKFKLELTKRSTKLWKVLYEG